MAEEIKAPVAIRVTRPYGSDDEFLQHELDTLTRTTVMLLGAQSRPQGVILRFEITLATGTPLLRGEGRVVAFRPASQGVDAGLTLRFTRLDARSKALVDRAASVREARARAASVHPPRLESEPSPTPAEVSPRHVPEPPPTAPVLLQSSARTADPFPLLQTRSKSAPPPAVEASAPWQAPPTLTGMAVPLRRPVPSLRAPLSLMAPPSRRREELLDRLRQRAKTLSPGDVETLLASKRKRPAIDST